MQIKSSKLNYLVSRMVKAGKSDAEIKKALLEKKADHTEPHYLVDSEDGEVFEGPIPLEDMKEIWWDMLIGSSNGVGGYRLMSESEYRQGFGD